MPTESSYLLFFVATLLLNATRGADMLFVTTQAARHGLRHGLAAAGGIFCGTLAHIGFAVLGLSALLAGSASLYAAVKWLGAAYLVWLGVRMLWQRQALPPTAPTASSAGSTALEPTAPALVTIWRRGVLINLLNPKVVLFFVAFLPQFIDPGAAHHLAGLALLGLSFNVTGTLVKSLVAVLASRAARLPAVQRLGGLALRVVGATFIGLGLDLALSRHHVSH